MGRKIPGKRHRGTKDPEKQQAVRFKRIKNKINAPPSNPDEQDMPKSLQRLIELKEKLKNGTFSSKRNRQNKPTDSENDKQNSDETKVKRSYKMKPKDVVPRFKQNPGETDRAFMYRVNQMAQTIVKESQFEDKYGVKVKRNYETGEVEEVIKKPKDEVDEMIREAKKLEKEKGKKNKEPRLTKSQKKTRKLAAKKEKKAITNMADFENYKDTFKFGDVVHEPPTLVTPKKVSKLNCAPRPGKKDLLLKSVLKENASKPKVQFPSSNKKTVFQKISSEGKVDKKGKRKDLPAAVRRQLESQRSEVVNAYRNLKAKKTKLSV